jgi:hypothetical protein
MILKNRGTATQSPCCLACQPRILPRYIGTLDRHVQCLEMWQIQFEEQPWTASSLYRPYSRLRYNESARPLFTAEILSQNFRIVFRMSRMLWEDSKQGDTGILMAQRWSILLHILYTKWGRISQSISLADGVSPWEPWECHSQLMGMNQQHWNRACRHCTGDLRIVTADTLRKHCVPYQKLIPRLSINWASFRWGTSKPWTNPMLPR